MSNTELNIINMADVEAVAVKWLWKPYIPLGKITIIQGDPGEGKTTLALSIAAAFTQGENLPNEVETKVPMNVIYQTAEDGLADTIKPRLEAVNADCARVLVIDESKEELSMTDERIEKAIQQTGAKLIILDPIQAYIGANVDMQRDTPCNVQARQNCRRIRLRSGPDRTHEQSRRTEKFISWVRLDRYNRSCPQRSYSRENARFSV